MRPLRLLILVLVLTAALLVALIRPLPGLASDAAAATRKHVHKHAHRRRHWMARARAEEKRGKKVVKYARRFIGTPYVWGGSSPRYGFDCSGFVRYVYEHFGVSLPHSSYGQMDRGRRVLRKYLKPGDVLFFDGGGHVGIYVGGNRVIDAPHSGAVVHISTMSGWYSYDYDGARRLLPG